MLSFEFTVELSIIISHLLISLSFYDNKTFTFTQFHSYLIAQRYYRTAGWTSPLTWWRRRTLRGRRRWRMWKLKTVIFELNPRIWEVIQIRPIYSHLVQNLAEDGLNFTKVSQTWFTYNRNGHERSILGGRWLRMKMGFPSICFSIHCSCGLSAGLENVR